MQLPERSPGGQYRDRGGDVRLWIGEQCHYLRHVADNQSGNVYSVLGSNSGTSYNASLLAGTVVAQSAGTFTVTASASAAGAAGALNIIVAEYSNLTLNIDKAVSLSGTSASVTTTNANDVILGVIGNCCAGNAYWALSSGFTQRYPSVAVGTYAIGFGDAIVTAANTYSYSFGCTPSYNCGGPSPYIYGGIVLVALQQAGGGGGTTAITIQTNPSGLQFSVDGGGSANRAPDPKSDAGDPHLGGRHDPGRDGWHPICLHVLER